METRDMIHELYRHMAWADAAVWKHVLAHETLAADMRLQGLLHHIHLVQRAYLTIWTGGELKFRELATFESPAAIAQWGREGHGEIARFIDSIDPQKLDGIVDFPWRESVEKEFGTPHPMSLAETLLQIPMHSMNHRGQFLMKVRELGTAAPILDFIAWVWKGKPDADWIVV